MSMSETILIFGYDEGQTRTERNHAEQNRELQSRLWQTSHLDGSQIVRSLKHEWPSAKISARLTFCCSVGASLPSSEIDTSEQSITQQPYFQPGSFAHCWKHDDAGSSTIGNVVPGRWPSIRWL